MNELDKHRKNVLIELLINEDALDADRDDAAMDLGEEFEDESVLETLFKVGGNHNEPDMILNSWGEAIGKIWVKHGRFDKKKYISFPKPTKDGIYCVIKNRNPIWLKEFDL